MYGFALIGCTGKFVSLRSLGGTKRSPGNYGLKMIWLGGRIGLHKF